MYIVRNVFAYFVSAYVIYVEKQWIISWHIISQQDLNMSLYEDQYMHIFPALL